MKFLDHKITPKDITPLTEKVKAITELRKPNDKRDLLWYLFWGVVGGGGVREDFVRQLQKDFISCHQSTLSTTAL